MSLSDLASLGSFVSGIAVVITLVVLVVQTRQRIKNQRSLIAHGQYGRTFELVMRLSEPALSDIACRVDRCDSTLSSSDLLAFTRVWHAFFAGLADSYTQYRTGTLDRTSWDGNVTGLKAMATIPSVRVSWKMIRTLTDERFRDFVDGVMADVEVVPPPVDYAHTWAALMSAELAPLQGGVR